VPGGIVARQVSFMAVAAALAELSQPDGRRVRHVSISYYDVLAFHIGCNSLIYTIHDTPFHRDGRRASGSGGVYPYTLLRCADGDIAAIGRRRRDWIKLTEMLGSPAWATERFPDPHAIAQLHTEDDVDPLLEGEFAGHTREALFRLARANGVALAPVQRPHEVIESPELNDVDLFLALPDGGVTPRFPVPTRRTSVSVRTGLDDLPLDPARVPRPDLSDLLVVDLTWVWSGPLVSAALADLGALVLNIEHEGRLDHTRQRGKGRDPNWGGIESVRYFQNLNRSKRSITLNLKDPADRESFEALLARADLLLESFSPGTLTRLGYDPRTLITDHPGLVVASMSGSGHRGPLQDLHTYAPVASSYGGLEALVTDPADPDTTLGLMSYAFADPNAGIVALGAVLAGLYASRRTGQGRWIDLAQIEAVSYAIAPELTRASLGQAPTQPSPQPQRDADGWHIADGDRRVPVWEIGDLFEDPYLRARGVLQDVEHPVTGAGTLLGYPWQRDGRPVPIRSHAPLLGEANGLLTELLHEAGAAR
jgi:crotonobetainyl-CoA:carnitine CoA-transferase CaiB-like acyl-CoA transferase